jgi:hypothetical protein
MMLPCRNKRRMLRKPNRTTSKKKKTQLLVRIKRGTADVGQTWYGPTLDKRGRCEGEDKTCPFERRNRRRWTNCTCTLQLQLQLQHRVSSTPLYHLKVAPPASRFTMTSQSYIVGTCDRYVTLVFRMNIYVEPKNDVKMKTKIELLMFNIQFNIMCWWFNQFLFFSCTFLVPRSSFRSLVLSFFLVRF